MRLPDDAHTDVPASPLRSPCQWSSWAWMGHPSPAWAGFAPAGWVSDMSRHGDAAVGVPLSGRRHSASHHKPAVGSNVGRDVVGLSTGQSIEAPGNEREAQCNGRDDTQPREDVPDVRIERGPGP